MKKQTLFEKAGLWLIAALNLAFLLIIVVMLGSYSKQSTASLNEENLNNIDNLNQSAASIASAYFQHLRLKLADVAHYAAAHEMTPQEALDFINDATSSGDTCDFQLIAPDGSGYLAKRNADGLYIPLSYQHMDYYQLHGIFSAKPAAEAEVLAMPEFTDNNTAIRSFALYTYLPLSGGQTYTLMAVSKSRAVVDVFNLDGGYSGMSTSLFDAQGDYILSNSDFKATNFFDYLHNYNGLTLDQRNDLLTQVRETGMGNLYNKNSRGESCVFRYSPVPNAPEWYCVTAVPLSSFHSSNIGPRFTVGAAVLMFLLLVIDVGWLAGLNRQLRNSMDKEREANSAKTDFLSRMSHDIRTPLNGIIGTTYLAMDENNPPVTAEYLQLISASGSFLLGLVNDVLDMSKVESGSMELHPEPYPYAALQEYLSAVIVPLCNAKDIHFDVIQSGDQGPMRFDPLRLNQILFNLLANAVKFTPAGGRVSLSIVRMELGKGRAALDFTVRDNGIGISKSFQAHMFEPFSQEKRQKDRGSSGTGLGLAIVKNLVTLMNGTIRVESEENRGSAFFIHLESETAPESENTPRQAQPFDASALQGKRILLCEDNAVNAMIATRLLEKQGVIVDLAENGKLGLEAFLRAPAGYYCGILMDVMMPEMDGLAATKAIRAANHQDAAHIPIVAMTANAYASDVHNCMEAGMNAHIPKPIQPEAMLAVLVEYMGHR